VPHYEGFIFFYTKTVPLIYSVKNNFTFYGTHV